MINPKKADETTFTGISGNFCLSTKKNIVNTSPSPLIKREKRKMEEIYINGDITKHKILGFINNDKSNIRLLIKYINDNANKK